MPHNVRVVILMGVSGSGKTTTGQLLAKDLNWRFYEGDDFHPKANVDKLSRGIPLTDEDRASWLAALHHLIQDLITDKQSAVISCSALKQTYRDRLAVNRSEVAFVYLKGSYDLTHERLLSRTDHFMKAELLTSQFDTLEEPKGVLTIDIAQEPDVIV
ncbi:MAG: gluconokinase, partial [Candidatus Methylomirabilales bacterium]